MDQTFPIFEISNQIHFSNKTIQIILHNKMKNFKNTNIPQYSLCYRWGRG